MKNTFKIMLIAWGMILALPAHTQQDIDLVLQLEHSRGELELKWYPMQAELWDNLQNVGYQVERTQLNDAGELMPETRTLLTSIPIFPKDSLWCVEHATDHSGYVGALSALMYDTDFQYESDLMDALDVRYQYLVGEVRYSDNIAAEVLGLYWNDETMVDGLKYRYRVFAEQNGQTITSTQVDMTAESGEWLSHSVDLNFTPPDGISLTEMSGRLKENEIEVIRMIAKAYGDSIVLRWGPNTSGFWSRANKEGYRLVRMMKVKGGILMDSLGHIKPWSEEEITEDITKDTMALLAAQCLYGGIGSPPTNLYEQSSLLENRFGFALYSAERSALAADILGLRFVDKNVIPDREYSYIISSAAAPHPMSGDVEDITNTYVPDPAPFGLVAESKEHAIHLKWSKEANENLYSAYIIERSEDGGKTYKKITPRPIVFMEDEKNPIADFSFLDSVDMNYKTFHYRLKGFNAFAELSEAAEVSAQAVDLTPPPPPIIKEGILLDDLQTMRIRWSMNFPPEDFAGYRVLLGSGTEGRFDTLTNLFIPDSLVYEYVVPEPTERSHFFKVLAFDKAGNSASSLARFIHFPDLIPPEPPTNFEGIIDEDGIVTLFWDHSVSDDVQGYRIFYAHTPNSPFMPVNGELVDVNTFKDTIPTKTMNEVIYYYVSAEDDNYNNSEGGEIIELARPDEVPPLSPLLNPVISTDSALILSWTRSGSEDVILYELLKKEAGTENAPEVIASFPDDSIRIHYDFNCELDKIYEYSVRALDDADNYSDSPIVMSGSLLFDRRQLSVSQFEVRYDEENQVVNLEWDYQQPAVLPQNALAYRFYLFKSLGGLNVKEFVRLEAGQKNWRDEEVGEAALYNYAIQVVYDSGHSGPVSDLKSILVEQ